jgi:hypothetical protein
MMSDPDPTDVMPTTRPPTAPTSTVGTGRRRSGPAGAAVAAGSRPAARSAARRPRATMLW